jgi:hypothetical protein
LKKGKDKLKELNSKLEDLLYAVEQVRDGWVWFPDGDYGSSEAIISSGLLIDMQTKLKLFIEEQGAKEDEINRTIS